MKLLEVSGILREAITQEHLKALEPIIGAMIKQNIQMDFTIRDHPFDRSTPEGSGNRPRESKKDAYREFNLTVEDIYRTLEKLVKNKRNRGILVGYHSQKSDLEAVVTNTENDLNIVFAINYQVKPFLFKVVTIHQRKNFKPKKPKDKHFYVWYNGH